MKAWLIALLLVLSPLAQADVNIETIPLQHRLAEEVLPEIRAFLPEDATVSAYRNTLIIKADKATIANVELLLQTLDQPQQSVSVSVLKTDRRLSSLQGGKDRIRIDVDEGGIRGEVGIKRWSTKDAREQDQQYHARGIAGQPLSISLGQDVPQQEYLVFLRPRGGAGVQSSTYYISVENGFQAVPVLLPDNRVRVEIHPFFAALSPDRRSIDRSSLVSSVVGAVGEWLEIGYISDNIEQHRDGYTRYHSDSGEQQIIYLKVDLLAN